MIKEVEYLLVLNTCPDAVTAKQIAQDLIAHNIAACVNIIPGLSSHFKWNSKLESDAELLLLIKTTSEHFAELQERIQSLHPYELPEIIAVSIKDGLAEYLRWIDENTK